jgi:hypothetical protein
MPARDPGDAAAVVRVLREGSRPHRQARLAALAAGSVAALAIASASVAQEAEYTPAPTQGAEAPIADDALESDERARQSLLLDVRAYEQAIAELEVSEGAFSPQLSEQLLGLGLALQRNGNHAEAIQVFKRGVHLARINEGLYSRRQLALLQGEIASHVAMGAFTDADERQRYLYRVQARTLSDTTRGEALMQHALWQRQAYEARLGEEPVTRLTRMWSLYRLALSEYVEAEGETSKDLLPPLYGMLRAQYLLSGFVGEQTTGRYRLSGVYPDEHSSQMAYRNESYKQGSAVIRAIYDVRVAQEDASLVDSIESMVMLADWKLWHGKRSDAMETYGRLFAELASQDAAKGFVEDVFSRPEPLPNIRGVRALPPPIGESERERDGLLLLEFAVTDRGRVVDLERLDEYPGNDTRAEDIMRRLRQTPFRPRISDGLPVRTEGVRWAYDVTSW